MRSLRSVALLVALGLLSFGCDSGPTADTDASAPPLVCEPGTRQECACPVASGMQDCTMDGSAWGECMCPITGVVLDAVTHQVDLAGDPDIVVMDGELRMPLAGHEDIAALAVGDILVHFGEPPILRRILATRTEGDTLVLETRLAGLGEAFEELHVHLDDAPVNMYGALPQELRDSLEASRVGLSGGAGGLSFGASGELTAGISISDDSRVWFEPSVDVDIDVGCCPDLNSFRFVAGLDAGFDITTTVGLSARGSVSAELELIEAVLSNAVPPVRPPEIRVYLGAGLYASPKLIVGCELAVEGSVEITSRVHASFDLRGGVEYDEDWDGSGWRTVNERTVTGGAELIDNQWEAGVALTCYVRPRIELTFLEVVTGYAQVGPEAVASLEMGATNAFSVDVGVRGTVGYEIGVDWGELEITLHEDSYDLFNLSQNLYYEEFTICGDGYRQQGDGDDFAEECDPGLVSSELCTSDCRCAPTWNPVEFYPEVPGRYRAWGSPMNTCRDSCGDGIADPADFEVCDQGRLRPSCYPGEACAADCSRMEGVCGDGIVDSLCGEACDDGNTIDCDGCSSDCWHTDYCGDGINNSDCGEQCDDGNTSDADACTSTCTIPRCGNGVIERDEVCDDGNADDCDGCHNDCTTNTNTCGDRHLCGAEECDQGPGDHWSCDADCTFRACNDGHLNAFEECDVPGPGCDVDCTDSFCGDGTLNVAAGEECDGEDWNCDGDCTRRACGDGYLNPFAEACDDGDTDDCTAGCAYNCLGPARPAVCGDGYAECGEACDDGPRNGSCGFCNAGCTARVGVCGDGTVTAGCGEICDDGNTVGGDGCRADCRGTELCGDLLVDVGETCDDGDPAMCSGACNGTCTGTYAGTCGDGTLTAPCEICEDTSATGRDLGCPVSEPNCAGCGRCSADVCGDGRIGPTETCELTGICQTAGEESCVTSADCPGGAPCGHAHGEGDCNETCTRIQVCGDGFIDGSESCDDGNLTDGDGCSSYCTLF